MSLLDCHAVEFPRMRSSVTAAISAASWPNWKRSISCWLPLLWMARRRPRADQVDDFIAHFITLNTLRINPRCTHEIKISPFVVLLLLSSPFTSLLSIRRVVPEQKTKRKQAFTLHAIFKHNLFQFVVATAAAVAFCPRKASNDNATAEVVTTCDSQGSWSRKHQASRRRLLYYTSTIVYGKRKV